MSCFCTKKQSNESDFGDDEVEDLIALFGAINISGTGRIDKDEFADLFYHLDLAVSDEYLLTLFNAADKDGSGAIEIGDFLTTFYDTKLQEGVHESRLKETFEKMDLNKNGLLSQFEIKECMRKNCMDATEHMINAIIKDADTNEDGQISYTEFLQLWKVYGKKVTRDRTENMYEAITGNATDGRIRKRTIASHANEETMTTWL